MASLPFSSVARLPLPGDNVAIATRRLERDTEIATELGTFALDATVLEGHRFAIEPIAAGKQLLSWQMPFGTATVGIEPGQYVCNDGMLEALAGRAVQMDLPATPNFESEIPPFVLDAKSFRPGEPVPVKPVPDTFMAYPRSGGRGSGTRNVILLLGTSSLTGGFVRALEAKLQADADALDNVDAIVAVAHTEGAVPDPNNLSWSCEPWPVLSSIPTRPQCWRWTTGRNPSTIRRSRPGWPTRVTQSTMSSTNSCPSPEPLKKNSTTPPTRCATGIQSWSKRNGSPGPYRNSSSRCSAAAPTRFRESRAIRWPPGWRAKSSATAGEPISPKPTS